MEAVLRGEVEDYLEKDNLSKRNCDSFKNYRNGTSSKLVKSSVGEFELETPRDRNSNF
jgi:putative transposase